MRSNCRKRGNSEYFFPAVPLMQSPLSQAVAVSPTGRPFLLDSSSHWAAFTPPPALPLHPGSGTASPCCYLGPTPPCSLNPSCSHFHKCHFIKISLSEPYEVNCVCSRDSDTVPSLPSSLSSLPCPLFFIQELLSFLD